MTSKLQKLLLGQLSRARSWPDRAGRRGRTAHRLHRADDRHLRPGRQGHGRRLPAVSRRARRQARRRRREVHRRGRPGQAGRRRHQGQEADPAGQGPHVHRRPAGLDRLRAGAGQHRREDALHLLGLVGRRPDAAPARQISVFHPHQLDAVRSRIIRSASGPATRATRRSSRSPPTMPSATKSVGGFQKAFEDCGGKIIQKIWPPLGTKDFGPYIPTIKADADAIFTADGRPDGAAIPQAVARRPATRSRSSAAASAMTNSRCRSWATK